MPRLSITLVTVKKTTMALALKLKSYSPARPPQKIKHPAFKPAIARLNRYSFAHERHSGFGEGSRSEGIFRGRDRHRARAAMRLHAGLDRRAGRNCSR